MSTQTGHNTIAGVLIATVLLAGSLKTSKAQGVLDKLKEAARKAQQQTQQRQGQPQQQPAPQPGQRPQAGQQRQPPGPPQAADSGPVVPPPGTRIETRVLAPVQEGAQFFIGPGGKHVATVAMSGSRSTVWYDGVEGPKFDEILMPGAFTSGADRVVFSPDGNRYAYCARAGNEVVVMVDGKELRRTSEPAAAGGFGTLCTKLGFTSNSKHVYYQTDVWPTNGIPYSRFVFDGVPNPPAKFQQLQVAYSPDGEHYAYVWEDPNTAQPKPWQLIIDGKPAPYRGTNPQWTGDSRHLYTQIQVVKGNVHLGYDLLLDGKPLLRSNDRVQLFTAPTTDLVVAIVTQNPPGAPSVQFLVVGGKNVPGSETAIGEIVFSPDGKRYAAKCGQIGKQFVIVDGKKGLDYATVDKISFTADSSKVVYQAVAQGNRSFVVVGEQESDAFLGLAEPVVAPVGNRAGGFLPSPPQLFLDGKTTRVNSQGISHLSFSPDGTRNAFVSLQPGSRMQLVVDGELQANSLIGTQLFNEPRYAWSPDSKHIAHFHEGQGFRGIFLNGKVIPMPPVRGQGLYTMLSFTPDSKHIVWAVNALVQGDQGFRIFIDGKPVYEGLYATASFSTVPGSWVMEADGALAFITQDDDNLIRVSITPSQETSLATLLAMAR